MSRPATAGSTTRFPSERLELEALGRAHHLLATEAAQRVPTRTAAPAGPPAARRRVTLAPRLVGVGGAGRGRAGDGRAAGRPGAGPSAGAQAGWRLMSAGAVTRRPPEPDDEWCAGFLGGMADAVGATTEGVLRLSTPDEELVGLAAGALHRLGFAFTVEQVPGEQRRGPRVRQLRLAGGGRELLRFLAVADPAVSRLRGLAGSVVGGDGGTEVVDISPVGGAVAMFDITTGTGDFVAEGVVSHNCFARNTHTYLDLDAGADFDRELVVKVNVARVLDRELRAPRWQREPVAMGTNTDPYQRAEGRYRLMPDVIDALARSRHPVLRLDQRHGPRPRPAPAECGCRGRAGRARRVDRAAGPGAAGPARAGRAVAGGAAAAGAPHHRRRAAVRGDGRAGAADAHRLGRGARRAARTDRGRRAPRGRR